MGYCPVYGNTSTRLAWKKVFKSKDYLLNVSDHRLGLNIWSKIKKLYTLKLHLKCKSFK